MLVTFANKIARNAGIKACQSECGVITVGGVALDIPWTHCAVRIPFPVEPQLFIDPQRIASVDPPHHTTHVALGWIDENRFEGRNFEDHGNRIHKSTLLVFPCRGLPEIEQCG